MSNTVSPTKFKHLTLDDRTQIQTGLEMHMTFKAIAKRIGKDPTTVSYEIKHHRLAHSNAYTNTGDTCPQLLKPPFVCNGCPKRHYASCRFVHQVYTASRAQQDYHGLLTGAREGIYLSSEDFFREDAIISQRVADGQHIYQIKQAFPEVTSSISTIYRRFSHGDYSVSRVKLPRAVKFRPRKIKPSQYVPKGVKIGRTYQDYEEFMIEHPKLTVVEMDTVIGEEGGKVLLTLIWTNTNFMIGLLLDNKTALAAATAFRNLKTTMRTHGFDPAQLLSVLLTDNGGEFADVYAFENREDVIGSFKELSLFFCDPMQSWQKPHVEKNHTLLRDILPKGSSFNKLTQENVNLIFSHINAVQRASFGGKSAYEMFCFVYSKGLADALCIRYIPPQDVIQSRALLRTLLT